MQCSILKVASQEWHFTWLTSWILTILNKEFGIPVGQRLYCHQEFHWKFSSEIHLSKCHQDLNKNEKFRSLICVRKCSRLLLHEFDDPSPPPQRNSHLFYASFHNFFTFPTHPNTYNIREREREGDSGRDWLYMSYLQSTL